MDLPTLDQVQARHRRELKDLQGRITNKKKNATKKTRKGVNDECAAMEEELKGKQAAEIAALSAETEPVVAAEDAAGTRQGDDSESGPSNGLHKIEQKIEEKLEKATEKLHISGQHQDQQSQQQTQPPEEQQQAGKKRNRQKERMARRAAEQEQAAIKAEEEASTMTDHRARESEYMRKMFAAHDLVEKDIDPDGHCLFSAVADQLQHNAIPLPSHGEPPYKIIRRAATGYMAEHGDDFAPFLEDDLPAYLEKMRDTAEWGGQLELMALARRFGVEIRVVQDGRTEKIGEEEGLKDGEKGGTGKVLWLAYYRHGYGLGEHYNSLRRKT